MQQGEDTSNTEDEDEDGDQELRENIEMESDHPPPSTQPRRGHKGSHTAPTVDKGKGKATSQPGPIPDEAKEEALKFGQEVMEGAEVLAEWWNTSKRSILVAAGLMLRESRAANAANKHRQWYACHFPMESGSECLMVHSLVPYKYCL